jgi:hypothetical protein
MTITKAEHRKLKGKVYNKQKTINLAKRRRKAGIPLSERLTAYGDSYTSLDEHQVPRDEIFMDRNFWILHRDNKRIIELLEKIAKR